MLEHARQFNLWGCLYHAAYAITGEGTLLDHVCDLSNPRFYARLHGLGLMSMTLYASTDQQPTDSLFWEMLRSHGTPQQLLLSIAAVRLPGIQHAVAVELTAEGATVSDSRLPALQTFLWPDFLAGPYALAFRVEVLLPAEVDAYPHEDAEQALGRALVSTGPPRDEYRM